MFLLKYIYINLNHNFFVNFVKNLNLKEVERKKRKEGRKKKEERNKGERKQNERKKENSRRIKVVEGRKTKKKKR